MGVFIAIKIKYHEKPMQRYEKANCISKVYYKRCIIGLTLCLARPFKALPAIVNLLEALDARFAFVLINIFFSCRYRA